MMATGKRRAHELMTDAERRPCRTRNRDYRCWMIEFDRNERKSGISDASTSAAVQSCLDHARSSLAMSPSLERSASVIPGNRRVSLLTQMSQLDWGISSHLFSHQRVYIAAGLT